MPEISRTYNNPLASHQARHHHDLRGTDGGPTSSQPGGAESEPSGGETRAEHEANKPKHPVDEALRPAHVLGGEKNMGAPEILDVKGGKEGGGLQGEGLKGTLDRMMGDNGGRTQEGLTEGVGGLEGKRSGLEGAGER
ncbi:hypothetical protein B0T09DRAFT_376058 [Sordaria sp. MPI-SDFR-AT-0083]|nr:hypothetical protein B0T09DRAFT_376058 [Sordaria sp. MPI-SDFR-AT-0083]